MGQVLATIKSQSNPGKEYNIIEGNDGVIYCECQAWKMKKNCKHLTIYYRNHAHGHIQQLQQAPCINNPRDISRIIAEGISYGRWE